MDCQLSRFKDLIQGRCSIPRNIHFQRGCSKLQLSACSVPPVVIALAAVKMCSIPLARAVTAHCNSSFPLLPLLLLLNTAIIRLTSVTCFFFRPRSQQAETSAQQAKRPTTDCSLATARLTTYLNRSNLLFFARAIF